MQLISRQNLFHHRNHFNRKMEASYDQEAASTYRKNDERDIKTPASRAVISHLRYVSKQFSHKFNVLDVGCGTGRFFHALDNVKELMGLDISGPMLMAAQNPVNKEQLDIESMKLVHSDFLAADLPLQGFDLIYAIGVFGHPAPMNKQVLDHFYRHLAPGGRVFFTIANPFDSKYENMFEKSETRLLVEAVFDFLPNKIQALLNARWQNFFLSQGEMEELFTTSQFRTFRTWPLVNRFIACEAIKP